jgi:hypothetical protein
MMLDKIQINGLQCCVPPSYNLKSLHQCFIYDLRLSWQLNCYKVFSSLTRQLTCECSTLQRNFTVTQTHIILCHSLSYITLLIALLNIFIKITYRYLCSRFVIVLLIFRFLRIIANDMVRSHYFYQKHDKCIHHVTLTFIYCTIHDSNCQYAGSKMIL